MRAWYREAPCESERSQHSGRGPDPAVHDIVFAEDATIARCSPDRVCGPRSLGEAVELAKTGAAAARSGRCEDVKAASTPLLERDAELHDHVFVHVEAVARCLGGESPCLRARHDALVRAQTIDDPRERLRAIRAAPVCAN